MHTPRISKFIDNWAHEIKRVILTLAIIAACFYPDFDALRTTLFIAGVFFAVGLISHLVRKYSLFPYIDLRKYAQKSMEDPIAASIVFASVTAVIVISIHTASTFFAR